MAVQATFFNWQRSGLNWDAPPYEACSPNLTEILKYITTRWGGRSLGCHHDRPIVGGRAPSSHAFGAALDWRYGDVMDRGELLTEVIPWLVDNSAELGIDAIHDYAGDRIWRAGRTADIGDAHTLWWKTQNGAGGQMGHPSSVWLHLETPPSRWDDRSPVVERLAPTRRVDLLDISEYQTITKWADVPDVPIVHRVITKEAGVDARFGSRMPVISKRTTIFGGYLVLVGGNRARIQIDRYVDAMRPFWRDGAFTQIDVEPWPGLPVPSLADVSHVLERHDAEFGPGRAVIYLNPYVLPDLWAQVTGRFPRLARWVPGYRPEDDQKAARYGAAIHQWSDTHRPSGFTGNTVDANEVRDWEAVKRAAGLTDDPGPVPGPNPPKEDDMVKFVRVSDDTAVYAVAGLTAVWMQNGPMLARFAQIHGVPASVDIVADKASYAGLVLVGPQPQGKGVTSGFSDFAGHVA